MKDKKPSLVVGTFIISPKKRLLLVKNPKWGNQWMIPGGHVEMGETLFETAKREAFEEVGVKVKPLGVLAIAEDPFPKGFLGGKKHFLYVEMICSSKDERVKMDGIEAVDYRWFPIKEALKSISHPLMKRVLKTYLKYTKKGDFPFINTDPK